MYYILYWLYCIILYIIGYFIGVMGFFVLSSFLLTHRLMIDLNNVKSSSSCFVKIGQYAIRRFFRIYLVFAIFWTLIHFGPSIFRGYYIEANYAYYSSGLALSSIGVNFLWTIPTEIKYYFFIPVISYASVKSGKRWPILWLFSSVIVLIVEIFNPFGFTSLDYNLDNVELSSRFTIFFVGSQLAIIYFNQEKMQAFQTFLLVNKSTSKKIFDICLVFLFIAQFFLFSAVINNSLNFYKHSFISGLYQVLTIFILLHVDNSNPIAKLYNSYYLRTCGRYSFGIYLFHPTVIQMFRILPDHVPKQYHKYMYEFVFPQVLAIIGFTYLVALIWFYLIENNLMKLASKAVKTIDPISDKYTALAN
jgi:peptidoglycan/LPS O-acetylase OafA/YrhL